MANAMIRKFPPSVVVVRNAIPAELLADVKTPNNKRTVKPEHLLPEVNSFLVSYAEKYGFPVGYDREKDGAIVQDIYPMKKDEKIQISSSSSIDLQMHTETAFHPYKPDWVILGCVKGDKRAETLYATLDEILYELDEPTLWELRQGDFVTSMDASFMRKGEPDKQYVVRPVSGVGDWTLTYDADLMTPLTDQAAKALGKLAQAVRRRTRSVVLGTGDILVLNNRTTVHGRKPFKARYDGTDRWLKRILVRDELPPAKKIRGNVILSP